MKTMTIPRHPKVAAKRATFTFQEIPKPQHDLLVQEYWKTWLSAWGYRCANEAAVNRFVTAMEAMVGAAFQDGAMDSVYGVTREDVD